MDTTKLETNYRIRIITREELLRFLAEGKHLPGRKPSRRSWAGAQTRASSNQ
jgi:hypothetical protein